MKYGNIPGVTPGCSTKVQMAGIKSIMQALMFAFFAIDAVGANECDQSVVKIEIKAQSDAYVDLSSTKNFGKATGLFLQNEGKVVCCQNVGQS